MRVLVWITEAGWEACVDAARALDAAAVTLLYVASDEVLEAPRGALAGLLGRQPRPDLEERYARMSDEAAEALLAAAAERLGREARRAAAVGRPEAIVMEAARDADLLVVARDTRHPGPKSIAHPTRFVVDHAPCALLLVWTGDGPQGEPPRPPHHPPGHRPPPPH
jgi:nucleotide-binding universal stress UspA family protein